jgi:hypothetical protein
MKPPLSRDSLSGSSESSQPRGGFAQFLRNFAPTGMPLLVLLMFFLLAFLYAICTQYIQPDEFAIKQVDVPLPLLTGAAGIHTNVYQTGIQWRLPGCEKFLILSKKYPAVTLHSKGKTQEAIDSFVRYEDARTIQTSDGFFINLDVSILYRVTDPYKVFASLGPARFTNRTVSFFRRNPLSKRPWVRCIRRFFNTVKTGRQAGRGPGPFNDFLVPRGLKVEHVLIRYPEIP